MGAWSARISNLESTYKAGVKTDFDGKESGRTTGISDIAKYQVSGTAADNYFGNKDGNSGNGELLDYNKAREGASMHMRFTKPYGVESPKLDKDGNEVQTSIAGSSWNIDLQQGRLTNAQLQNFSGHLGSDYRQSLLESAGHDLSSRVDFSKGIRHGIESAMGHSVNKDSAERLSNSFQQNLSKAIENNKSLRDTKDAVTGQSLSGSIGGGLPLKIVKIGGEYDIKTTTKDGTESSIIVSGKDAEDFKKAQESAWTNTLSESTTSSTGISDALTISKNTGASEAYHALENYSKEQSVSDGVRNNLMTGYIRHLGDTEFNDISDPKQRYAEAAQKIESMASGSPEDIAQLNQSYREFSSQYFSSNRLASDISDGQSNIRQNVRRFSIPLGEATDLLNDNIQGVNQGSSMENQGSSLQKPDEAAFNKRFDDRDASLDNATQSMPSTAFGSRDMRTENITGNPGEKDPFDRVKKTLRSMPASHPADITIGPGVRRVFSEKYMEDKNVEFRRKE
jgi:hypothetical protein